METNNSVSYSRIMNMIEAFEIYCDKDAFFEKSFLTRCLKVVLTFLT